MNVKDKKLNVTGGIESLVPYPPGKPIEELERELGITGSIKLASNENPIGPSKKAVEAITKATSELNRYPDGSCFYLKEALSKKLTVPTDMIIVGNGSNEIIELLIRTFLTVGEGGAPGEVIMGDPSFAVYPLVTQAVGGKGVKVALTSDLNFDLARMLEAINKNTKIVFIANPNNPTGAMVSAAELKDFMSKVPEDVIVCIDEAYFEYVRSSDFPDTLEYIKSGKSVVLLRTFSKVYGLAGLRVGYGVASSKIINYMERVRQPFNVNSLGQAAALGALEDSEHLEEARKVNSDGLDYLFSELASLGYECVPTEANFFLVKVGEGSKIYDALLKTGVIVRPMKGYGMDEYIRVTVGTASENKRFIEAFSVVIGGNA